MVREKIEIDGFSFHRDMAPKEDDEVFVFGSNLKGRHGKGAAKAAMNYGAKYGVGIGLCGMTYAIPTRDANPIGVSPADVKSLSEDEVIKHCEEFKRFCSNNPSLKFYVTRVGCGLAGFSDKFMAKALMVKGSQCNYPIEWYGLV